MFEERGLIQGKRSLLSEGPMTQPRTPLRIAADKFDEQIGGLQTLRAPGGQPIRVEIEETTGDWNVFFLKEDCAIRMANSEEGQMRLKIRILEACQRLIGEGETVVTVSLLKDGSRVNVLGLKPKDAS
jgi:hypothetical protein